jgi:hypothetical protein
VERREVEVKTLDSLISTLDLEGTFGIKIDTEGFELSVIRGAKRTLKQAKFVFAEIRHNHVSIEGSYKLHQFVNEMQLNGFILSKIVTAKPFIADLCFEPLECLDF